MNDPKPKRQRGRPPKQMALIQPNPGSHLAGDSNQFRENERVFICDKCGKGYLSNPALYLHTKYKHKEQTDDNCIQNGELGVKKRRGRPSKISMMDTSASTYDSSLNNPLGPYYMKHKDRKGGPTNILFGFSQAVFQLFKIQNYTTHPFYGYLLPFE